MPLGRFRLGPAARPLAADVLLAVAVAVIAALVDTFGHDYRSAAAPYWDLAFAAPLALRRRLPATAAAAIAAICLAQWLVDVLANGDLVVLVVLYSLGAWERRRWLITAALVVAETGVVMAVSRWAPGPHQWVSGLLATGTVTAALLLGLYVRTRRDYLVSMIERAETAERDRDHQAQIAVAGERARMAREMHDVIAHSLAVMITLNDAAAAVATDGTLRDTVTQASDVGRQALTEMQRLLGVLRSAGTAELVPQPGIAELGELIAIIRSAGPTVELTMSGDLATLPATAQLTIYRIVQESLTNVLKHGRNVRHVAVSVAHRADRVEVRIADDGESAAAPDVITSGHGLAGMRERSALYGGVLRAGPSGSGGWAVTADLGIVDAAGVA